MSTDPRAALDRLVAALEAHLLAAGQRRGERDPGVEAAYRTLADAFETYDEALYDAYDEITPFVLYDDVEDEREDSDDDDLEDDDSDDDDEDSDDDDSDDESLPIDDLTDVEGDHDDEAAQDEDDYEFEPRRSPDTSSRA
jgi:AAA ATPase containing von Willebrand factor type A (vWA) domain